MARLYDTPRWRKQSRRFLDTHPLCVLCAKVGRDTPSNTVDHIIPHKGNLDLFWDEGNWQSVCPMCHNASKRMQELHGHSQACDINGFPIDMGHSWNEKKGGD